MYGKIRIGWILFASVFLLLCLAGAGILIADAEAPGDSAVTADAEASDDSAMTADTEASGDGASGSGAVTTGADAFDGRIHIQVDGVLMNSADIPIIENGRVLIPLRAVVEYLGGTVHWYPNEQQIVGFRGARGFDLIIGAAQANLSSGGVYGLDVPAKIISGRTYVPLRFVSEAMGCQVVWEYEARIARITTARVDAMREVKELAMPVLLQVTTDKAEGSGFIYTKDGQVITTAELVAEANWILVTTVEGTEYQAEPLIIDHVLNLAKLRIKREPGETFPVFRYFDDFSGLTGEEKIFVLASPLLEEEPVAAGIIAAKLPGSDQSGDINVYEVTATINEKNNGGPLLKENGALIGVNCYTESDGERKAYAIPIEYVFEMRNRVKNG